MAKYRFDQIAFNSTEKKKPVEEDRFTYLGLEHLDSGSLKVTRFGADVAPVGEKLVMHKGDVLFGKRRAYQKKVAIAPFDGIFSAHGMVLRPKVEVIDPYFFPLFISSDYFLDAAIKISVGSLSPTINWRDLKILEFNLPDIETQRKLAAVLWSINDTMESYKKLISATDELVKSQFIEMFGEPVANTKQLPVHQLTEYIEFLTSGSRGWAKYHSDAGEWFITIKNVKNCKVSVEEIQHITPPQNAEAERSRVHEGDLLISITADLGRTGVVTKEIAEHGAYINQHLTCIRLNKQALNPTYVAYFMESTAGKRQFFAKNLSSVKAGLNFDSIRTLKLMVPPLPLQQEFVEFLTRSDKSKYHIQKSMTKCSEAVYEVRSILYPKCYLNRAKME